MTVSTPTVAPEAPASGAAPAAEPNDQEVNGMSVDTMAPATADPRPGSRADRLAQPMAREVLRAMAEHAGICVRPVLLRRTDLDTGQTEVTEVPCGARSASKCKPCAERIRRLRIQQIREGWHLDQEPTVVPGRPAESVAALVRERADLEFERRGAEQRADWSTVENVDRAIAELEERLAGERVRGRLTPAERKARKRAVRSTRRRRDVGGLPRLPVETRTVGRTYAGRNGRSHRPSMLLTTTLGSYGPVHSSVRRGAYLVPCECGQRHYERDPLLGTPLDPATYDYRRAALDAIHFARLLDRFWQNLRRAAGWKVQYAGAVELQRRLAPHAHFAVRGTIPRRLCRQVAEATYHQVWWPPFDTPLYTVDNPPVWDPGCESYVDPKTSQSLPTWAQAVAGIAEAESPVPAYVAQLGRIDPREIRGVQAGTRDAERTIRYVTKYVTKDLVDHARPHSDAQRAHFDRLHEELSTLPCSPVCANWLLYGVQPDKARKALVPGRCKGRVHQRTSLGFTGRRVLVSRQWSLKTLADHRADNRAWVQAVLGAVPGDGDQVDDATEPPARWAYELARSDDPDVPPYQLRILRAIGARLRHRAELAAARGLLDAAARSSPNDSATPTGAALRYSAEQDNRLANPTSGQPNGSASCPA